MQIDRYSFELGMINCFAEMVAVGVKRLALSPPLTPDDYAIVGPLSDQIVQGFGIRSRLETSLLVTDLQSADFTKGKWSILYFKTEDVLRAYEELKTSASEMEQSGIYTDKNRRAISRRFMELLSYPPDVIDAKLNGSMPDPFMLIDV